MPEPSSACRARSLYVKNTLIRIREPKQQTLTKRPSFPPTKKPPDA